MKLAGIDIGIFVVFMMMVIALGYYASRKTIGTKRDYFLAGDKLAWWMIGGSIVAANISTHHIVGIMGSAYERGFPAMCNEWGAILVGFNALLWIFLPFYLRNGFYTVPEFLQRRYGGAARIAYGGLIFLTYVFVEIAGVLYLGAITLNTLLGIPFLVCVISMAAFTALYTVTGGLRAVVWTEMLQLVVLLAGGLAVSIASIRAIGWGTIMATSKDWHILLPASDPDYPWTQYLGASLGISVFYCAANQFIVQRVLAAKDEWHARMGVIFTDYLKLLIPLIIVVPGMAAALLYPHLPKKDMAFATLVENLLPPGLVGLVMAGLVAAAMSHISGTLNSCATIAAIDFYLPYLRKDATEAQAVRFGRIVGIAVITIGVVWSLVFAKYSDRPVWIYLMNAYGYFAPGISAMFILGIMWKRTTLAGALTAGILTIPLSALSDILFPHFPFANRTGVVFWLCVMAAIVVSLRTKPKSEEDLRGLIWNKESLQLPKEEREKMRGLRNPVIWWATVTAATVFLYARFH